MYWMEVLYICFTKCTHAHAIPIVQWQLFIVTNLYNNEQKIQWNNWLQLMLMCAQLHAHHDKYICIAQKINNAGSIDKIGIKISYCFKFGQKFQYHIVYLWSMIAYVMAWTMAIGHEWKTVVSTITNASLQCIRKLTKWNW